MPGRILNQFAVSPLSTEFICGNCPEKAMMRCSQCRSVIYCSMQCQKLNRSAHRALCAEITQLQKMVNEEEAAHLRNIKSGLVPRNVYEPSAGSFNDLPRTTNYSATRCRLGLILFKCGTSCDSKLALELSLEHLLVLMWLSKSDSLGARFIALSIYIMLDRLQEGYDFVKWWLINNKFPCGFFLSYKSENMFEDISTLELSPRTDMRFLLNLFLLKYKLFSKIKAAVEAFNCFMLGTHPRLGLKSPVFSLRSLLPPLQTIRGYLCDDNAYEKMSKLTEHLEAIVRIIDAANQYVIPVFLNPQLYLSQSSPESSSRGTNAEALSLVKSSFPNWQATQDSLCYLGMIYRKIYGSEKAEQRIQWLPRVEIDDSAEFVHFRT